MPYSSTGSDGRTDAGVWTAEGGNKSMRFTHLSRNTVRFGVFAEQFLHHGLHLWGILHELSRCLSKSAGRRKGQRVRRGRLTSTRPACACHRLTVFDGRFSLGARGRGDIFDRSGWLCFALRLCCTLSAVSERFGGKAVATRRLSYRPLRCHRPPLPFLCRSASAGGTEDGAKVDRVQRRGGAQHRRPLAKRT